MASCSSQSPTSSASTLPSTPPESTGALQCLEKDNGNRQHYRRWRPSFHLQPKSGWLNDPCAPGFDATTGLYHVSFQWNPSSPDWGDICWGTATSTDMIHWTVRDEPIICPDTAYDGKGVFTGCMIEGRDGTLTCAYTSVGALPIHHTLPHPRGCESLSLARSEDSGKSWQKISANPVLPCEPEGLDVTGWRDPYVSRWPAMAKTLELDEDETLFGLISGGIRDDTPTTFLYAIDRNDLTQWKYIGPLVHFGLNFHPSRWSGDLGRNWEVTNFASLRDDLDPTVTREVLVMGTEGCIEDQAFSDSSSLSRPNRSQLWMSGDPHRYPDDGSGAKMSYKFGGHLDHGCLYAANSFFDPQIKKQIVWGWIPEDDLCDEFRHAQGWSGMLSMPRELRLQTLQHVVRACKSRLQDITSIEVEPDGQGSSTVRTLGMEPLRRLVDSLRHGADITHTRLEASTLHPEPKTGHVPAGALKTDRWELRCSIKVATGCERVGLRIAHSIDYAQATTFAFHPTQETFVIERPAFAGLSSEMSGEVINSNSETAPHTLFTTRDPASGFEETEALEISAWRDNSVLEVFVNGRTAISTRLYAAEETFGLQFFADDGDGTASATELLSAEVWDNIGLTKCDEEPHNETA